MTKQTFLMENEFLPMLESSPGYIHHHQALLRRNIHVRDGLWLQRRNMVDLPPANEAI